MKKHILSVLAISVVTILCSFNVSKTYCTYIYLTYDGTGSQKSLSNYSQSQTQPSACPGSVRLCWIRCCDHNNDGAVTDSEFVSCFESYDLTNDAADSLDDEVEIPGQLEKKNFF